MSRKKLVRAAQRSVWAYDNAHDVVMAHLVEVGVEFGLTEDVLSVWRNAASLRNLGFDQSACSVTLTQFSNMLKVVRMRVLAAGDLSAKSLVGWSVLGGCDVSDGFIRGGPLPAQSILDVVDGLQEMISGSLPADPPNEHWYLGPRTGRSSAPVGV